MATRVVHCSARPPPSHRGCVAHSFIRHISSSSSYNMHRTDRRHTIQDTFTPENNERTAYIRPIKSIKSTNQSSTTAVVTNLNGQTRVSSFLFVPFLAVSSLGRRASRQQHTEPHHHHHHRKVKIKKYHHRKACNKTCSSLRHSFTATAVIFHPIVV